MIQIYYGKGKGKTSAAIGAAARAAGQGMAVLVVQFMKDRHSRSGEVAALEKMEPAVTVLRTVLPYSIFNPPGEEALKEMKESTTQLLHRTRAVVVKKAYELIVLDELGVALIKGWLEDRPVREFLDSLDRSCEVVITGREVPRWLLERADLITEMVKIRHPFDEGQKARKGIEY